MNINKPLLIKGIIIILLALPLFFLCPLVLTIGMKAVNDGNYIFLILGGLLFIATLFFSFWGFRTIVKALLD